MLREVQKNRRSEFHMKLRRLIRLLVIIAIFLLIFYFVFYIKNITIVGNDYYSTEEIKTQLMENPLDHNAVLLFYKLRFGKGVKIPFVQEIDVQMSGRDTLLITVFEKKVVGYIEFMGENMYFDKDGVIVETTIEKLKGIPNVTGLRFDKVILHEPLEVQNEELFDTILNLTLLINKYEIPIDNIFFTYNNEVILTAGDIKASLGRHEMYDEVVAELKNPLKEAMADNLKGTFRLESFKEGQKQIIFDEDKKSSA